MSFKHDPRSSLRHIVENAEALARNLAQFDKTAFHDSEWARAATERHIERVCEAVFRLGDLAEDLMPGQPWASIRAMGNRLRHAYDTTDEDIVWDTATIRVPALAVAATLALNKLTEEDGSADEPAATRKRP